MANENKMLCVCHATMAAMAAAYERMLSGAVVKY